MTIELREKLINQLEWVKNRLSYLELIEEKLQEMKTMAEYVRDNKLAHNEINDINQKLKTLEDEVYQLDLLSRAYYEKLKQPLM